MSRGSWSICVFLFGISIQGRGNEGAEGCNEVVWMKKLSWMDVAFVEGNQRVVERQELPRKGSVAPAVFPHSLYTMFPFLFVQ